MCITFLLSVKVFLLFIILNSTELLPATDAFSLRSTGTCQKRRFIGRKTRNRDTYWTTIYNEDQESSKYHVTLEWVTVGATFLKSSSSASVENITSKETRRCYRQRRGNSLSKSFRQLSIVTIIGVISLLSYTSPPFIETTFAAPPFAVIAEELGYFPITDPKTQQTIFVPQKVRRSSSEQSVQLANILSEQHVVLFGTYWCPHTTRQKEFLGSEAFQSITYVECSPKGYRGNPVLCMKHQIDGYPTWYFPKSDEYISGERPLSVIAKKVGMSNFQEELEQNAPPILGSESCR